MARFNFVGSDRPDLECAAKEASRSVAVPHVGDIESDTHAAQLLLSAKDDGVIRPFSDSAGAWCLKTRTCTIGLVSSVGQLRSGSRQRSARGWRATHVSEVRVFTPGTPTAAFVLI